MPLSSFRMYRIFIAANMDYDLGSYNPDEIDCYNVIRKEMDYIRKESVKKEVSLLRYMS